MPVEEMMVEAKAELKPKLDAESSDYQLIQDDIISVEAVPVELKWDMTDKEFDEYKRAASRFLKDNKEFREESLRRFLRENNVLVYSPADAGRLLRYKNNGQTSKFNSLIESERYKEMCKHLSPSQFGGVYVSENVFLGFIPSRVVKRIDLVLRKFSELCCFISDNKDCPETFVAVTFGKDSEVFVIDMWNKKESATAKRGE